MIRPMAPPSTPTDTRHNNNEHNSNEHNNNEHNNNDHCELIVLSLSVLHHLVKAGFNSMIAGSDPTMLWFNPTKLRFYQTPGSDLTTLEFDPTMSLFDPTIVGFKSRQPSLT